MTNREIKNQAELLPEAKLLLETASDKLGLSARGYMRTIRVARTIADLVGSKDITTEHIDEALQYRLRNVEQVTDVDLW